ncbi:MAG: VOC family protein [Actinobacteria bacterium]|nr:VOC family protein [Actinomycetota bacterium]
MFDHVALNVRDLPASRAFYEQALTPLGYRLLRSSDTIAAFGTGDRPELVIRVREPANTAVHVAFNAQDRPTVDAFHAAGLAAGGTDNGAPGIRERYHPAYYAAFVIDPDGNNIEAVCHVG